MFPLTAKFKEHSRTCYKLVIGIEEEDGKKKKPSNSTLLVLAETSDGYSRRISIPFSIVTVADYIEKHQQVGRESVIDFTKLELAA